MSKKQTMLEEITAIASELSHATESEENVLDRLCTAACGEIEGKLCEGISKEDCEGAFICAAAWLAAAALASARSSGEDVSSLRAGDLSVTRRSGAECAQQYERLRKQAWELMAPYVKDSGFCFRGVRG